MRREVRDEKGSLRYRLAGSALADDGCLHGCTRRSDRSAGGREDTGRFAGNTSRPAVDRQPPGGDTPRHFAVVPLDELGAGPRLRATPAHAPGVGIGLTLVARFAELHGGRAWVEERPGGGSSFRVLLPDAPQEG